MFPMDGAGHRHRPLKVSDSASNEKQNPHVNQNMLRVGVS